VIKPIVNVVKVAKATPTKNKLMPLRTMMMMMMVKLLMKYFIILVSSISSLLLPLAL
jgi:hypothetical protein